MLRYGRVAYRVKYAGRGGTHRVTTPVDVLTRLAALVAPPRYPLVRDHGVLASHKWRRAVVAQAARGRARSRSSGKRERTRRRHEGQTNVGAWDEQPERDASTLRHLDEITILFDVLPGSRMGSYVDCGRRGSERRSLSAVAVFLSTAMCGGCDTDTPRLTASVVVGWCQQ